MRKILTFTASLLILASSICVAAPKKKLVKAVYQSDIHCKNCASKVENNIAFEKGVEDLKISVEKKTISIEFNEAKTDTTKLANAINKLGYSAELIEYKVIK